MPGFLNDKTPCAKVQPGKIIVEFGCEAGMEPGNLTAILVKATAKANVKVTVEWASCQQEWK